MLNSASEQPEWPTSSPRRAPGDFGSDDLIVHRYKKDGREGTQDILHLSSLNGSGIALTVTFPGECDERLDVTRDLGGGMSRPAPD